MVKRFFKIYVLLILMSIAGLMVISVGLKEYFSQIGNTEVKVHKTILEIPYGSSLKKVTNMLFDDGLIKNKEHFYWYSRIYRADSGSIQAGYYEFNGSYTYNEIIDRLQHGKDKAIKVIFKEGETLIDLANRLEKVNLCSKENFFEAIKNKEVIKKIDSPFVKNMATLMKKTAILEGYLYPETYYFNEGEDAVNIILKMHKHLQSKLNEKINERIKELSMSFHEVLTLASIVEKETAKDHERPIIASVYLNRLKIGMPLQADPTVIYGIKDYAGKISKKHLITYHPYNTYKIKGLPPGPISSVSIDSIRSVLWPTSTNYLYFVSKNDGSHIFCENLRCHNKAVQKWQIEFFKKAAK